MMTVEAARTEQVRRDATGRCAMFVHSASCSTPAGPGPVFTACAWTTATEIPPAASTIPAAGAGPATRREVRIGGRRVRTVDIHCHCVMPEALAVLGMKADDSFGPGIDEVGIRRIQEMDEQRVDIGALSINPFWYKADRDLAAEVVRINNEGLAAICSRHPDRFVAFASVALQFPDLAVQQLDSAVKRLGLRGVAVGATCGEDEFADPKFHPFWAKCEELGILVFVHPQGTPDLARRLKGNGWLGNVIGNPLDTTICLSHLIFEGTLDRFPGLKICAAHGGGYLPSYAARSDHGCRINPRGCDPGVTLRKRPTEYLRDLYYDTLVFTPEALRHLAAEVGPDRLMIGSDHPYPWQPRAVDHVLDTPWLSDEEKVAILGGTAAMLLGLR
jgi:aminocarboxymuconate-semialdehyde decarboxylase